jgi:hypothetical protein
VTEAMLSCTSGMLLCLDREQRLSYIPGAIFDVSDTVTASCWRSVTRIFVSSWRARDAICATS